MGCSNGDATPQGFAPVDMKSLIGSDCILFARFIMPHERPCMHIRSTKAQEYDANSVKLRLHRTIELFDHRDKEFATNNLRPKLASSMSNNETLSEERPGFSSDLDFDKLKNMIRFPDFSP